MKAEKIEVSMFVQIFW